jgi:acetoacetyl-CoA synthetase
VSAQILWQPSAERIAAANMTTFAREAGQRWGRTFADYAALHRWSVEQPEEFWSSLWDYAEVIGNKGAAVLRDGDRMPGAHWFPEAHLNFARNLLCRKAPDDPSDALVFWGEDKVKRRLSHAELYGRVAQVAAAMRAEGIVAGDRVAAFMPNLPETVIVMLAAASIGATFSSASPDFGVQGVLDRFGQIEPRLLFATDGYYYNGKVIDCREKVAEVVSHLPSLQKTIMTCYIGASSSPLPIGAVAWEDFLAPHTEQVQIDFAELPFDHPLFIMYSSGTTGAPKCIVHGAGGALLQHLKEHRLHGDVMAGDRMFYFTTCGWMMWNWLASGLASGATLLLYDGSPFLNTGNILFDYADAENATHFGTSAKFIDALAKAMVRPRKTHRLAKLRVMFSTGSPLTPEGFDYVHACVKADLQLASICGGTDIISCFIGGNPTTPVWRGEIQCAGLGMATDVFDEKGNSLRGAKGELVCTRPFPAMPIGFWNDPEGVRYLAAYFERFPGVWHHGDFVERTDHDGFIVYGRSDATLNPGGVRIGTAEIYRQVEHLDEVLEALVIGQDWPPGRPTDIRVVLFVKLRDGLVLDETLAARIKQTIRDHTTPRHVPARIVQVKDIPRTKSGKIVELAVRDVVHGEPVKNIEALANPEALEQFRKRPELAS